MRGVHRGYLDDAGEDAFDAWSDSEKTRSEVIFVNAVIEEHNKRCADQRDERSRATANAEALAAKAEARERERIEAAAGAAAADWFGAQQ